VWVKGAPGRQARAVRTDPARFFIPPYVGPSGWIGVDLDADTRWSELADILRHAWRLAAPPRMHKALGDEAQPRARRL
jgi:hypothetical protein